MVLGIWEVVDARSSTEMTFVVVVLVCSSTLDIKIMGYYDAKGLNETFRSVTERSTTSPHRYTCQAGSNSYDCNLQDSSQNIV